MMGPRQEAKAALFYEFSLEDRVPDYYLLRSIDQYVDLSSIRAHLAVFLQRERDSHVEGQRSHPAVEGVVVSAGDLSVDCHW